MFQYLSITWGTTAVSDTPTPLTFANTFAIFVNFSFMILARTFWNLQIETKSPSTAMTWTFWFHVNMVISPFKHQTHSSNLSVKDNELLSKD